MTLECKKMLKAGPPANNSNELQRLKQVINTRIKSNSCRCCPHLTVTSRNALTLVPSTPVPPSVAWPRAVQPLQETSSPYYSQASQVNAKECLWLTGTQQANHAPPVLPSVCCSTGSIAGQSVDLRRNPTVLRCCCRAGDVL